MLETVIKSFKWFCAPRKINPFVSICLFIFILVPMGFMSAYYNNVIIDYRILNENPMFQMVTEADAFVKDLKKNVSGHDLINQYIWLRRFQFLIRANCQIQPSSLINLRYTGHFTAIYNTLLMHLLLSGTLPVSLFSCIPIMTSIISTYIEPSRLYLLGIFEFSQIALAVVIFLTYSYFYIKPTKDDSRQL